jgi:hypothetical protein
MPEGTDVPVYNPGQAASVNCISALRTLATDMVPATLSGAPPIIHVIVRRAGQASTVKLFAPNAQITCVKTVAIVMTMGHTASDAFATLAMSVQIVNLHDPLHARTLTSTSLEAVCKR